MNSVRKRLIDEGDLIGTQVFSSHPGGTDMGMLERYLEHVKQDRLTPDALAFYGRHIEATDEVHLVAWIDAVLRYAKRDVALLKEIRVRPSIESTRKELLQRIFEQSLEAVANSGNSGAGWEKPGSEHSKVTNAPVMVGYVRGFQNHVESEIREDPLGILLEKFREYPEMWQLVAHRLPESHQRILHALCRLDSLK